MGPGFKVTLVGAGSNLFLSSIKFIGGILGNSTAMIADAFHSLSDLLTDGVVLLTHKIGQIPKDEDHPYGHGRAETIGATVVGSIIILAGFGLGYEVWKTIESGLEKIPNWIAAFIAGLSILIKEGLFHYTRIAGEQLKSPSIVANAWHHRSDAVSSIAALIGVVGALNGHPIMDPLAGGVVAVIIIKFGYDIAAGGVRDLMDTALSEEKTREIHEVLKSIPQVIRYHDLRARGIGGEVLMDVHVQVKNDLTVSEGHTIAETVRRKLIKTLDNVQDVLVHIDPEDDDLIVPVYSTDREALKKLIGPLLLETESITEMTKMQLHFFQGKNIVDLFIRMDQNQTTEERDRTLQHLKKRLESEKQIDEINFYLDINQKRK